MILDLAGPEKDNDEYKNPGSGEAKPQWKLAANVKDSTSQPPSPLRVALKSRNDPATLNQLADSSPGIPDPGGQRSEVSG